MAAVELNEARKLGLTFIDNETARNWEINNKFPGLLSIAFKDGTNQLEWTYYWHTDVWESIISGDVHAYRN